MRRFGLIGFPLDHSFSQKYFSEKFVREGITNAAYELFPLPELLELPKLLAQYPDLQGLNVTIPHKQTVLPWLHTLDETARAVGAVNCIRIRKGHLTGFNTDVTGFEISLHHWLGSTIPRSALILGAGGAARAVAFVLNKRRIPFQFVVRKPAGENQLSYAEIPSAITSLPVLIVNATPVGTFPNLDEMPPFPLDWLGPEHLVYDLVYNPPETLLLREAKARGCAVKNGLEMLHEQAEKAWALWQD